jgi:nucleotide-binding universal stress UspA family protein
MKEKRMFKPMKILVPTDFSKHSDNALSNASDIAEKYNSKIYLLHVIDNAVQQCAVDYCIPNEVVEKFNTDSVISSRELMKNEVRNFAQDHAVEIEYDIKKGNPYEEIIKEQEDKDIDLIVMGSHGKTGFIKHMMGGVAERVLRNATSQVLMVK